MVFRFQKRLLLGQDFTSSSLPLQITNFLFCNHINFHMLNLHQLKSLSSTKGWVMVINMSLLPSKIMKRDYLFCYVDVVMYFGRIRYSFITLSIHLFLLFVFFWGGGVCSSSQTADTDFVDSVSGTHWQYGQCRA